ncbi:hypothetical protein NL676_001989 [Syzygium grande]|nr:hypothetical protein NL676_001989 [Syzygium grande]
MALSVEETVERVVGAVEVGNGSEVTRLCTVHTALLRLGEEPPEARTGTRRGEDEPVMSLGRGGGVLVRQACKRGSQMLIRWAYNQPARYAYVV